MDSFNKCLIENTAEKKQHIVLRLPPYIYHCMLNPIEKIWSQVKGYTEQNNMQCKMTDVWKFAEESLANIRAMKWCDCMNHFLQEGLTIAQML